MKKAILYSSAAFLTIFGLMTLFLSASIILDLFGIREKEGNYVLFVVWANFVCSLLYLFSAYGFIKARQWTTLLLGTASILLLLTFIAFKIHINSGGMYETKTTGALIFRFVVTLVPTLIAFFAISKAPALKTGNNKL